MKRGLAAWSEAAALVRHHRGSAAAAERAYRSFALRKQTVEEYVGRDVRGLRILEVGCGQRFAQALLFHSWGARITGIDLDPVEPRLTLRGLLALGRRSGVRRLLKTFVRRVVFDRRFYRALAAAAGRPLNFDGLDLRRMDVSSLVFRADQFDYVFSASVFEHVADVAGGAREIARVLKPGGLADIKVHLFPSLSGGHNLMGRQGAGVPPWDHLRENRFPCSLYLNRLREPQYVDAFRRHLEILRVESEYEGRESLTDALRAELADYTEEELLKSYIRLLMRAPDPARAAPPGPVQANGPGRDSFYIFDFDRTLFESNTTLDYLAFIGGATGSVRLHNAGRRLCAGALRRLRCIGPAAHMRIRIGALRGLSRSFLREQAARFVRDRLPERRRTGEWDRFQRLRAERRRIVIVSFTLDLILEAFARDYPVERTVGATLLFKPDGRCAGRYERQLQETGKLRTLLDFYDQETLRQASFVTDNPRADRDLVSFVAQTSVVATPGGIRP